MPFSLNAILLSISAVFIFQSYGFFSFLEDKTFFKFLEDSFYAFFKILFYVGILCYFLSIPINEKTLLRIISAFLFMDIFHFFLLFLLPENKKRLLLVGKNKRTELIIEELMKKRFSCYEIKGILTYTPEEGKIEKIPIIGTVEEIDKFAEDADIVVFCFRDWRKKINFYKLRKLKLKEIKFEDAIFFYEKIKKAVIIDPFLRPSYFLFQNNSRSKISLLTEEMINRLVALAGLIILLPFMIIIAILIKLDSPGPVFYTQERVGLKGRRFKIIKFRSMVKDAEKYTGPVFAKEKDPRITKIGRFLRKFGFDEFPQLFNVLKGDMYLIGPRPERPYFVEKMKEVIPYYDLRHTVKPGITGWAQVNYKYGDSIEDGKNKLEYDLYYIRNRSLFLDLVIIFSTLKRMILGRRRF